MRHTSLSVILIVAGVLSGCHDSAKGDAVRAAYDNRADQIERQAERQSTPIARKIYRDRADAFREEGKDRQKGIEGGSPSKGSDFIQAPTSPPTARQ